MPVYRCAMRYREFRAPPGTEDLIHCLWHLETESAGGVQPVVPDGRVEIVLHLGEPFGQVHAGGEVQRQHEIMVSGQLTRPIQLQPSSHANVIGIRLTAVGAGTVLPTSELTDRVLPLHTVRRDLALRLIDVFARGTLLNQGLARLGEALAVAKQRPSKPAALNALKIIETAGHSVRATAAELGVTTRTLERSFRDVVGVSPVLMRRIVRFRRAFSLLSKGQGSSAARVAASAGYHDQAHLIRDFRRFAGAAPGKFFREQAEMAEALLGSNQD
jgi:AraC-like DNA-binding protein